MKPQRDLVLEMLSYASNLEADSLLKTQVILFYAHWCGHCKNMMHDWNMAKEDGKKFAVWKEFDCDKEESQEMMRKYDVTQFPTVMKLRAGKMQKYEGERTKDKLVNFARG